MIKTRQRAYLRKSKKLYKRKLKHKKEHDNGLL